jgi:protein-tyrosine kinase
MERIQAAIRKAKEQRMALPGGAPPAARGRAAAAANGQAAVALQPEAPIWAELPAFHPSPRQMERSRIVTFSDRDPAHTHFDMLRTKVLRLMRQHGWVSLGVTSPSNGCGKTTTCINLAFSLAHQPDVRTVLVDLDLRRPAIAHHLGLDRPQSMASVLQGTRPIAENFVRYGDTLAIGTNAQGIRDSAELLMNAATAQGVADIREAFRPDVILYDLPPMLMSDDAAAFMPHLDCVLLVAGAEKSRLDEVDKCEHDLAEQTNVIGIVLNMCRYSGEEYGYY